MESNQPQDGSTNHNVSSTSTEVAEHPGSEHHHNKVNDITSSESSTNRTRKRSRHDFEGELEGEEEEEESTKSSSSSSSSDTPAGQTKRARTPPTLCKIKGDVHLYLMKFILVDDLKNMVSINKLFKGIVRLYLQLLLKQSQATIILHYG